MPIIWFARIEVAEMEEIATFYGFARADGRAGIRNHVAVIPSVACANGVAAAIAKEVPEVVPIYHGQGCARGGTDLELHYRTLSNLAVNPNIAAVLFVGLGCEVIKAEVLAEVVSRLQKPVEHFNIQEVGGSRRAKERGVETVGKMLRDVSRQERMEFPLSALTLGLECGGSDAFSGVTANPSVGLVTDWLVEKGGTAILTESTEMIGTGHILERRARNDEVGARVVSMIEEAEKRAQEILGPFASYVIAPGNMDGGMSSIREKSLGCILKGGSTAINQAIDYAEMPAEKGLVVMDGPGYDVESLAGVAAAGSQLIIFTTGRGNPIGFPVVPVIKVASTSRMYERMTDDMDINAGEVLEGASLQDVADKIKGLVMRVANGEPVKAEINQQNGILCMYTENASF